MSAQRQADIIRDGIAEARRLGYVDKVFVYTLRNHGPNLFDREQNFGLLEYNFTAKPSLAVMQSAATACTGMSDTLDPRPARRSPEGSVQHRPLRAPAGPWFRARP